MEAATVSEGEMTGSEPPPEEGEEEDNMEEEEEIVWEMLDEMVRESAEEALEEGVQELARLLLWELLDDESGEVVEQFYQELLDSALSSSQSSNLEECQIPEEEEMQEEFDGILTEKGLVKGLSNLSHTAAGLELAYCRLSLPNYELHDITILYNCTHLQRLELPHNHITDLRCVSRMPYLLQLDASHNQLNSLADLKLPKNIKEVDLSYNQLTGMKELSNYRFLFKLNLDNNQIQAIEGLKNCISLRYLSLAENMICEVQGLHNLPIKLLCLRGNKITNVKGLAQMGRLHKLDLSDNRIESLKGLEDHDLLETISLEKNQIRDLNEIKHMQNLPLLRVLNLLWNPIQEYPDYLFWILFMVQKLTELDYKKVKATDKVLAINKYNPPVEVVAASDHMTHIMYGFQQHQKIYDSTLPNFDIPYPMLVLVGPQACGKRELAHMLCQEFSDYFGYCINHTSRSPYFGEEDGCDYHFVTEQTFEEMIQLGKFIETIKYDGNYYGLSREALEAVAREGLACCIHMELEGVRSLKKTYLEPRYILLIPMKTEEHQRRLHLRGLYTKSQIDFATSRVESYISMNQDYPGYFDAVISSDNLMHAYLQLSQLLREYLSLSNQVSNDIDRVIKRDKWQMPDLPKSTPTESNPSNWSKSSPSDGLPVGFVDSSTRNYSSRIQARLSAEKTDLEQCSIEQRQKVAREAVKGQTAGPYTSLFKRVRNVQYITSTSGIISSFTSYTSLIPIASSTDYDKMSRSSSDLPSSEATHSTPRVSSLSSADVFSEIIKPVDLDTDSSMDTASPILLSEYKFLSIPGNQMSSLILTEGLESYKELQVTSKYPSVQNIQAPSPRLGSNIKPILPPIPSGRTRAEIPESPQQAACTTK
ncbi:leucine-rich repeat and guanylate kinase domain-containing protein [Scyliorhinus canicula]|uniref:leucine-rich repeat and guanylate kinase domain-containing protein n=1 Tax=Scyliorhinus canicula TaxID=7830 RepID=UPI0018F39AF6|nr:leucine-rich repeat and guanylate kinase domain-containing protein [Scyliorhinus canicula]